MPIHQTKLMMAKPQPTGMLMPQMPTPMTQQVGDDVQQDHDQQRTPTPKPSHQPRGVGRVSTIALILSVTEPKRVARRDDSAVALPASAGGSSVRVGSVSSPCLLRLELGVGVAQRRPGTSCAAACSARPAGRSCSGASFQLRDLAVRIVEVAEDDRLGRAGRLAGGQDLAVARSAGPPSRRRSPRARMRCTQ